MQDSLSYFDFAYHNVVKIKLSFVTIVTFAFQNTCVL